MEYPKINSLYKREGCGPYDESKKRYECDLEKKPRKSPLIEGEYACPEFASINSWTVTEKVDGTNVRIILERIQTTEGSVSNLDFRGRTNNAQFPTFLFTYLQKTFTKEKMDEVFNKSNYVTLFGESYGPKIQTGGYYRKDASFILFDVYVSGWWLTREGVAEVAEKLGIDCVPLIQPSDSRYVWKLQELVEFVKCKPKSIIAQVQEHEMEGIIARSEPQMMFRKGGPIMFKLKCEDFK
jgi:ATP-dependent RNA circularization protein (DNA/RNA ligase family)